MHFNLFNMNVSNNRYIDVIDGSIALTLFDFTIIR